MSELTELEFWPEYNDGPLWGEGGKVVDLGALGLSADLRERLRAWNAEYDDSNLPPSDGSDWFNTGRALLAEVREALAATHRVIVHEDWWGEPGRPFRQPGDRPS